MGMHDDYATSEGDVTELIGEQGMSKATKYPLGVYAKDRTGERCGKLTAVCPVGSGIATGIRWLYRCDCGTEKVYLPSNAKLTGQCGCESGYHVHGMRHTPTYRSWRSMRQRCLDVNCPGYRDYGARGITICDGWKDFSAFIGDMGERPAGTTLGRINNDMGYCPENCRWETATQQNRNKRNCRILTIRGESKTVAEWARDVGLSNVAILHRLDGLGMSPEQAVFTPYRKAK